MTAVHVHLLLNHAPIFLTLISGILVLAGIARKSRALILTGLALAVSAALIAWPVILSGERAGDALRGLPEFSGGYIHSHEEAAELAMGLLQVLGGAGILGLILSRGGRLLSRWGCAIFLLLWLADSALLIRAAYYGGQVGHPEIRPQSSFTQPQ